MTKMKNLLFTIAAAAAPLAMASPALAYGDHRQGSTQSYADTTADMARINAEHKRKVTEREQWLKREYELDRARLATGTERHAVHDRRRAEAERYYAQLRQELAVKLAEVQRRGERPTYGHNGYNGYEGQYGHNGRSYERADDYRMRASHDDRDRWDRDQRDYRDRASDMRERTYERTYERPRFVVRWRF